ncbi:MAG: PfkB family carbohydrate kinase, partial [Clostridia bacterium]
YAQDNGKFIVYDPNFRHDFWKDDKGNNSKDDFISSSRYMISKSHVVKVSEEEAILIAKESSIQKAARYFLALGAKIILVTCAEKGAYAFKEGYSELVPSITIECVDSTGAGDAFIGAFLYKLSMLEDMNEIFKKDYLLKDFVSFANKAGAICCTRLGAMEGMPSIADMDRICQN